MRINSRRVTAIAIAAALAAGVAAAWLVGDYTESLERRGGTPVDVLVATAQIKQGKQLSGDALDSIADVRQIPRRYAPPNALVSVDDLAGLRAAVDIPSGSFLTPTMFLTANRNGGFRLRRGERAVSVNAVTAPDAADPAPGQLVDLYASGVGGGSETALVLAGAQLLAVDQADDAVGSSRRRITLRVGSRQAGAVVRADAFAKEMRALVRP